LLVAEMELLLLDPAHPEGNVQVYVAPPETDETE
jgi:hypothetical protein